MKKIVLFDIDYTLFDTELFREKLYKSILQALKMEEKTLAKVQNETIGEVRKEVGYFDPEHFSRLLAKKLKREEDDRIILRAIFKKQNFKGNYYKETRQALKNVSKVARLGIFSKGYDKLQREKLYALAKMFGLDDIHITVNKHLMLQDIVKKYKSYKVYIVDDALDILEALKRIDSKIFTVWVKRGFYADKQRHIKNFTPDAIIDDLSELIGLVK